MQKLREVTEHLSGFALFIRKLTLQLQDAFSSNDVRLRLKMDVNSSVPRLTDTVDEVARLTKHSKMSLPVYNNISCLIGRSSCHVAWLATMICCVYNETLAFTQH